MKRSAPITLVVALAAGLCLGTAAQAQNWKYRDAQGRIVVSDLPPPSGIAERDILERPAAPVRRAAPPAAAAPSASAPVGNAQGAAAAPLAPRNDPELEARRKKAAEEQDTQKKLQAQKDAAARSENCSRARSHLAALSEGLRMARTNDKGEREILDDKGRAEEMQRARQVIASDCK